MRQGFPYGYFLRHPVGFDHRHLSRSRQESVLGAVVSHVVGLDDRPAVPICNSLCPGSIPTEAPGVSKKIRLCTARLTGRGVAAPRTWWVR
eukprot:COSAG02_NODE_669_length_18681_cov_170.310499_14_plen_91_part_00